MVICAWIDGAAKGNPGPAGYGILTFNPATGEVNKFGGYIGEVTSNQAELNAVVELLKRFPDETHLDIYSDSEYVVHVLSGKWKIQANKELIKKIWEESYGKDIDYHYIPRGENILADVIANNAIALASSEIS